MYYRVIIWYYCLIIKGAMPKVFSSLPRQNLSEQVVREIGLSIIRNDIKPGDVLSNEPELSLQFNISRSVLREALKILNAKGLIESRPRTGTRVRPRKVWNLLDPDILAWHNEVGPDKEFLQAICEIRLMFEPPTAGLAALRASEEEVLCIERSCQRLQDAVDAPERYIPADLQFHAAICSAAHNELLQQIIVVLDTSLRASRAITSQLPGANQDAMPLHWAITGAIGRRDARAAEEAMRKLMMQTTGDIHRVLAYTSLGEGESVAGWQGSISP
jgi:GntR family transcriptional regulator, galactonate operon transcriptional repressor